MYHDLGLPWFHSCRRLSLRAYGELLPSALLIDIDNEIDSLLITMCSVSLIILSTVTHGWLFSQCPFNLEVVIAQYANAGIGNSIYGNDIGFTVDMCPMLRQLRFHRDPHCEKDPGAPCLSGDSDLN
jgi:hypothetical protein